LNNSPSCNQLVRETQTANRRAGARDGGDSEKPARRRGAVEGRGTEETLEAMTIDKFFGFGGVLIAVAFCGLAMAVG
jgi:hypothetical protein